MSTINPESKDFSPEASLSFLQSCTLALQKVLKAFEKQQEALILGDPDQLLVASQSAEAALHSLAEVQSLASASLLQDIPALQQHFAQKAPIQTPRLQLLLDLYHKLLQTLQLRRQENEALIQQAQHLNEAQLNHLVALHQNTQPVVYGAQGDNAPEFQASRSAYDFSA